MRTAPLELRITRSTQVAPQRPDPGERDQLIHRAKALSWLSLAYMTAEGAIAVTAALLAGSVALLGFGLDSAIEALASVIVIWRFTGTRRRAPDAERDAQRLVAVSFFLLAPYIAQDAIRTLITGEHPHTSWLGIGLSVSSLIVMPQLGNAKHRIGQRLGSGATTGEGSQNLLCAYLAAGVLASLALNAAFGLSWADPVVALGIAALAIKEGHQTWHGEGCCATPLSTPKTTPAATTTAAAERGLVRSRASMPTRPRRFTR
jgi:divalent metal cation (Fe/Co/Zn/Cd) transporter